MSRAEGPRNWRMTSLVMLISVYVLTSRVDVDAGMCSSSSCLNGGQMIMPNSVFGFCRCRCPEHFSGPKCQFISKRVAGADLRRIIDIVISRDDEPDITYPSSHDIVSHLHSQQRLHDSLTDADVE